MSEVVKPPSESAGEDVAERSVRVLRGRIDDAAILTLVQNRLGRMWLKVVPVCHAVVLLIELPQQYSPHTYGIGWGGCSKVVSGSRGVLVLTREQTDSVCNRQSPSQSLICSRIASASFGTGSGSPPAL